MLWDGDDQTGLGKHEEVVGRPLEVMRRIQKVRDINQENAIIDRNSRNSGTGNRISHSPYEISVG